MLSNDQILHERLTFRIDELPKIIGVSRAHIYREIKAGRLKIFKMGKATLIAREAIQEWLKGHQEKVPA